MQINSRLGELNIKLVYYGPPYSGKTTNLERLYATTNPQRRSPLTSMKNHEDRTLFFDFMQVEMGKIGNLTPRFNLYTVPGQAMYAVTRQMILRNTDAVVFVADSAPEQLAENIWSWRQLQQQLQALGYDVRTFPIIVQINKRDLPNALPIAVLRDQLQLQGHVCIEAQALYDIGTRETLKATIRSVLGST